MTVNEHTYTFSKFVQILLGNKHNLSQFIWTVLDVYNYRDVRNQFRRFRTFNNDFLSLFAPFAIMGPNVGKIV